MLFKVIWDNGHACGAFFTTFPTREEAERFAEEWRRSMIEKDHAPKEAEKAYSYEIQEVDDGA